MGAPAIETRDLHMHYGKGRTEVRALDGVDLRIEQGEMVAIMGPSGSGKSTLLHIVGALESPTSGTIAVGGRQYEGLDDKALTELRRDHIGFVFQFFNLLPSLTAEENVGENSLAIRVAAVDGLAFLSGPGVQTLVIPAREDLEMAREAERVLG